MNAAEAEIDWIRASEDSRLIEACRAAASVASQFETARTRRGRDLSGFQELFRRLYSAARAAARA